MARGSVAGAALAIALAGAVGSAGSARAGGLPTGGTPVASVSSGSPPLVLTAQTPWVTSGQPFDLKLRAGRGTPPVGRLGVTVSVFPCLSTVSAFDQAASSSSGPAGEPISHTASPIPWTTLPATPGGGADLSLPVVTGTSGNPPGPPAGGPGGFAVDLSSSSSGCQAQPSGVYPVRVGLVDIATGDTVGAITTDLVFSNAPADTQKLRFAVVLPVRTTLRPAPSPTETALRNDPSAALARPAPSAASAVSALVGAIADHPAVPVTIAATPQTVQALAAGAHGTAVAQLGQLAATPAVHQLTSSPYVPVDASALVDAGMGNELAAQIQRGAQVLGTDLLGRPSSSPVATKASGPWITNDAIDDSSLALLRAEGYHQLVIPASDVSSSPTNGSTVEPFVVDSGHGSSLTAVTSSSDLSNRFEADPGNPVLAAQQLLAELAQIYYERPNNTGPRAIVAVAPNSWSADPLFVQTLLSGLGSSPIVEAVTVAGLFQAYPAPVTCRYGCRLTPSQGSAGLSADAVRSLRARLDAFASSAPGAHALIQQFDDLVLAAESEALRPAQRTEVLRNVDVGLKAQLGQVAFAGDKTITLTSRNGRVPVTINSSAPYQMTGTITLSSDKLLFSNGRTQFSQVTTLNRSTNVVYVNVEARASGEFKMDIALRSPSGGLLLADGVVTVRSTATSFVGVALSLGAVAVLSVWWIRTTWQRRRRRTAGDEDGEDWPDTGGDGPYPADAVPSPPPAAETVSGDP